MNLLPRLLHKLERAAHSREKRNVKDTIEILRRAGFHHEVEAAIRALPKKDASFVRDAIWVAPPMGGPGMSSVNNMAAPAPAAAVSDPMAGVTLDATSGKYWPSSATEWATTLSVAGIGSGGPSHLYNLQDASGAPADAIGSANLTVTSTPGYQAPVAGWSRLAITSTDGGTVKLSSTALPDPASNSYLVLALAYFPSTPGGIRQVIGMGSTTFNGLCITTTGKVETKSGSNNATGLNNIADGAVRLLAYRYNFTAGSSVSFTDSEKIASGTFAAASGNTFYLISNGTSPASGWLGAVVFTGSAAELSDAQVKTLEQTLLFSPSWS